MLRFLLLAGVVCTLTSTTTHAQNKKLSDLKLKSPPLKEGEVVLDRVVALVGQQVVLLSEVQQQVSMMMQQAARQPGIDRVALRKELTQQVVDGLIAEKLIEREIRKLRIDVTDEEVDRVVQSTIAERGLTQTQLAQALAQQGMTLAMYKEGAKKQLRRSKIVQLKVKNRVRITDEDVLAAMRGENAKAKEDFSVKTRHILFLAKGDEAAARAKADQALARIRAGEDFKAVAKDTTEDPAGKKNGGYLGTIDRDTEMLPEFLKAAFAAPVGQATGPVRTSIGWHIILVDEHVVKEIDVEAEKEKWRMILFNKALEQAFQQYVEELKQSAYIEVRL